LCLAFLDLFNRLVDVRIGRTKARDRRYVLLDEAEERNVREIGGDADFDNGFRLMFFWRIELGEAWPQNVRLPIVSSGSDGILLDLILNQPDLRPVIFRSVPDEDDLKQGFVRFQVDRMMELGSKGAQFFEEGNADLLEVLLCGSGGSEPGVDSTEVGDVTVEPNGPGLRGDLPFGSAKENADVAAVNGGDAWRHGFGFERVIDGCENDGVIGNVDDGAAAGEVGDDFVFLRTGRSGGRECGQKNQDGANE